MTGDVKCPKNWIDSHVSNEFVEAGTTSPRDVTNDGKRRTKGRLDVAIAGVVIECHRL